MIFPFRLVAVVSKLQVREPEENRSAENREGKLGVVSRAQSVSDMVCQAGAGALLAWAVCSRDWRRLCNLKEVWLRNQLLHKAVEFSFDTIRLIVAVQVRKNQLCRVIILSRRRSRY